MVLELPFRLRRLPLNGLMLSLAHHSDCYDECEVTVEVNGHVLATVTEDVAGGGTGTSLANDSAVVHSVHVPSPVLKHGELAPGNAQKTAPGRNTLAIRTKSKAPKYRLRALRLQPWMDAEPVSPEAVEAAPPPARADITEFWPIFSLHDWMHVVRSLEYGGSRWTEDQPPPLCLSDDEGEAFRIVGVDQDMWGTYVSELSEVCFDVEVSNATAGATVFYFIVTLDSRITGAGDSHDHDVPDFIHLEGCSRSGEAEKRDVPHSHIFLPSRGDPWFKSVITACAYDGKKNDEAGFVLDPLTHPDGRVVGFGSALVTEARRTSDPAARFQLLLGAIAGRIRRAVDEVSKV